MFTVKEVANMLKVHEMTIFRHIKSGEIKAIKIGSSWRISQAELDRIMTQGV